MKAVWTSFRLELCAAIRSRTVALLTGASLLWVLIVPSVLKGDGSASGWFELCVRYSLGVVFALVLVALAASASGSLAKDRAAKRLQLTLVRPVPHAAIAWGRMLALTAIGAFVLGLSAVGVTWRVKAFQGEAGYGRTCDRVIAPILESPQVAVDRRMEELRREDPDFITRTGEREVRRYLTNYVVSRYETVNPGEAAGWMFDTSALAPSDEVAVRIRVTDVFDRLELVNAQLRLGARTGEISQVNKTLIKVPLAAATDGEAADPQTLTLANDGELAISLCPHRDLFLLVKADSFGWNVFRAWLVLTAVLSLVVALAMTIGACLSRSVAIFAVLSLLVISTICPTLSEEFPDPTAMTWLDRASLRLTDFATRATAPLSAYSPISALESTSCIEWAEVGRAVGWNIVVLPLLASLLAGCVMIRKQNGM